jgi:hypothetical protein
MTQQANGTKRPSRTVLRNAAEQVIVDHAGDVIRLFREAEHYDAFIDSLERLDAAVEMRAVL